MKKKILPLLPLLYPAVEEFCLDYDYKKPSLNYLEEGIDYLALTTELCKGIQLTFKGRYISTSVPKKILIITYKRSYLEIISTLLHELAHAVQHYNIGATWEEVYAHQTELNGYAQNTFEKQARYASDLWSSLDTQSLDALKKIAQQLTE